jgi:hypothetical protein
MICAAAPRAIFLFYELSRPCDPPFADGHAVGGPEVFHDMRKTAALAFMTFLSVTFSHAQMVRRAWVGFGEYYYESAWTNTHAIVELSCGSPEQEEDIEVWYETADDTAVAGRDYAATTGSHLFHAGSPTRRIKIEVPLLKNPLHEDRTFRIRVTRADFPSEVSQSRGEVPVTITGLPPLTISRYQTNLFLTWRASATNFILETSAVLGGTNQWQPATGQSRPIPYDPRHTLALPLPGEPQFFRLRTARQ